MWSLLRKLASKSTTLNSLLGDVVFTTMREYGISNKSFFEWRVKKSIDESRIYVGLVMQPDGYAGSEGSPTNYIQFDIETAVRLRDSLNDCIEFARRRTGTVGQQSQVRNS